jgi:histone-lysine N-methyltransferase SETMAR
LKTREAITILGCTVLPHPPYSPDLAPSDFYLFGALKDAICGKRFGSDDEVAEDVAVSAGLILVKTWIHALVSRWRKAVAVGDYVEK